MNIDDPDQIAEIFNSPVNNRLIINDVEVKIKDRFSTKLSELY